MDERIIDVDGNEIIISVDGIDDFEIADISFEDAEELEGDLIITAKYLNVEFGEVYDNELDLDYDGILIPGFIDSHIHIESSKLSPSNFAKAVLPYGTTSVVADSHEIANVLGIDGINWMVEDGKYVPFDFYYAVPSCVPHSSFENSGAVITSSDVKELLKRDEMVALGEMNFPAVLSGDEEVLRKIEGAHKLGKPIDGHAPLLSGEDLKRYVSYGITTDHECTSFSEAIEKSRLGMTIMVREGSSAKDMDALLDYDDRLNYLIEEEMAGNAVIESIDDAMSIPPFEILVCDDIDAEDLSEGHLDRVIKKAISLKINPKEAIKMATFNPAEHYGLNCGAIEEGRIANFALVDDLRNLNVSKVWVHGELVVDDGKVLFETEIAESKPSIVLDEVKAEDFDAKMEMSWTNSLMDETTNVFAIKAYDSSILTEKCEETLLVQDGVIQPDLNKDVVKIAVVNRYGGNNIMNGFIKGFNLKKGAFGASVAHDSHNILVIGTNSEDMAKVVNIIREHQGGLAVYSSEEDLCEVLELPIAGLMSNRDIDYVADKNRKLGEAVNKLGCNLTSPFTTLSFMALLSIPHFKISNQGLFDVDKLEFIDLIHNF